MKKTRLTKVLALTLVLLMIMSTTVFAAPGSTISNTLTAKFDVTVQKEVVVKTPTELTEALKKPFIEKIIVDGILGSESEYTIYTIITPKLTIVDTEGSKIYGTIVVKADNVTIDGLTIQNKGNLTGETSTHRGAIYVYANSARIINNYITNGLGANAGLSNGMQVMRSTETINADPNDYLITGNTLVGHIQGVPNWSSCGIVVPENNRTGVGGNYYEINVNDYEIATQNTFINNAEDYVHQNWKNHETEGSIEYALVKTTDVINSTITNAREGATILLGDNISNISSRIELNKAKITLDGNNKKLSFTDEINSAEYGKRHGILVNAADVKINNLTVEMTQKPALGTFDGWTGTYGIQVYGADDVNINNYTGTNGDAALLVNGSKVTLTGNIKVSDNEFGGIEVTKGKDVTNEPQLTLTSETIITNEDEAYGLPTLWEDGVKDTITYDPSKFTRITYQKELAKTQEQYYLDADKSYPEFLVTLDWDLDDEIDATAHEEREVSIDATLAKGINSISAKMEIKVSGAAIGEGAVMVKFGDEVLEPVLDSTNNILTFTTAAHNYTFESTKTYDLGITFNNAGLYIVDVNLIEVAE